MTRLVTIERWYSNTDIETLQNIFGISCFEFKEDDGYGDFIDYCDKQWDKLNEDEKREMYECFS